MIYLDYAATTPIDAAVREAMLPWLESGWGNPSSQYELGARAAEALDRARSRVARCVGVSAERVTFTSGGTEANNLALLGVARAAGGGRVIVGPTEHSSVREAALALRQEGFDVEFSRLDEGGSLDLEHLEGLLDESVVLVVQMLVQNEFGTIYPIARVARAVAARAPRAHLHVDAIQALGKLDCNLAELGADSLSLSGHKVHGPKGAGAFVLGDTPRARRPRPLVFGGGQESGLRSGTEPVATLVGFGVAAEQAEERRETTLVAARAARAALGESLDRIATAQRLEPGGAEATIPTICAIRIPGLPAAVRLQHLAARGVMVGSGSACQGPRSTVSPALLALLGSDEAAREVLRFSFSGHTTVDEARKAGLALAETCDELEALRR